MKIGILSMQRICNYGSYLQAYALKKIIESLGHEVVFIDYKREKPLIKSKNEYIRYIVDRCKKICIRSLSYSRVLTSFIPTGYRTVIQTYYAFRTKYWPALGISAKRQYHTKVDTLIIGSDEVFNCLQKNTDVGFSRELFGDRAEANRIITYAASFGNATYDELNKAGALTEIAPLVSRHAAVSVRDKNSFSIMRQLLPDRAISENLDPVLMFDFSKRKRKPVCLNNYIIVYAYRGRLTDDEIEAIKKFAREEKKAVISICGYYPFTDRYIQTSPLHVLDYFENADYVITDTFHGTIFSIISHTKFGVFVRDGHGTVYGNSEKLSDLLHRLCLEDRCVSKLSELSNIMKSGLNFDKVDEIINLERMKAQDYLKSNI